MRHRGLILLLCSALSGISLPSLTGCMVGPNYRRPLAPVPPAFKGAVLSASPNGAWKQAQPGGVKIPGNWWELYDDALLNELEAKIVISNQTLKAAYQAYVQSREQITVDRSNLFPTFGVRAAGSRNQASANRPFVLPGRENVYSDITLAGAAAWEPDLWGAVRRTVQSSSAAAQASNADLASVALSLQSALAVDYFQLRGLDSEQQLLNDTVAAYRQYVHLTAIRFEAGLASDSDVALAQTQLDSTIAQATDLGVARAQYEDAIATLIGAPASSFRIEPAPLRVVLPTIPTGLPSDLLERRPDIAAAERRVDAANATIGVAQAAFYPTLNLNGAGGFESASIGTLIQGPSALWGLGASAAQTLFDAGRRHAVERQAVAAYEQRTANYRETVLQAFQEVEDNLSASRILTTESVQQNRAVADAERSLTISTGLYKQGLGDYLQVLTVQQSLLINQRTAVNLQTRQVSASVELLKSLGGGWNVTKLPKP
jgi:NodT family efflux transporter outer membrane factor (OMF) lipoprotein